MPAPVTEAVRVLTRNVPAQPKIWRPDRRLSRHRAIGCSDRHGARSLAEARVGLKPRPSIDALLAAHGAASRRVHHRLEPAERRPVERALNERRTSGSCASCEARGVRFLPHRRRGRRPCAGREQGAVRPRPRHRRRHWPLATRLRAVRRSSLIAHRRAGTAASSPISDDGLTDRRRSAGQRVPIMQSRVTRPPGSSSQPSVPRAAPAAPCSAARPCCRGPRPGPVWQLQPELAQHGARLANARER